MCFHNILFDLCYEFLLNILFHSFFSISYFDLYTKCQTVFVSGSINNSYVPLLLLKLPSTSQYSAFVPWGSWIGSLELIISFINNFESWYGLLPCPDTVLLKSRLSTSMPYLLPPLTESLSLMVIQASASCLS